MSKKNRVRAGKENPKTVSAKKERQKPISTFNLTRNWVLGLILGVTFLAFANTITNGFAYDDRTQILENQVIRSFANIPTAFTREVWFWRVLQDKDPNKEAGPTTPYYRPMFTIFLMIGWHLFQTWTPGWHI